MFIESLCVNDNTIKEGIEHLIKKTEDEETIHGLAELYALIEVGKFINKDGPIVSTQEAGNVYFMKKTDFLGYSLNEKSANQTTTSSAPFARFSHHFKIYVHGKAYIIENRNRNVEKFVARLNSLIQEEKIVNDHLKEKLNDIFQHSVRFMDSKRDRDVLKGIFAKATSVTFRAKLQGVQDKRAIMNCRDELGENIKQFCEIERTSMLVSNALTNEQQRSLTRRVIQKRKEKAAEI